MFLRQTYVDRRGTLASRFEGGLLLLPGNAESPINYADNCYHFRQDSTFLYYFGLNQADLAAIIDVEAGTATIFGDELGAHSVVRSGAIDIGLHDLDTCRPALLDRFLNVVDGGFFDLEPALRERGERRDSQHASEQHGSGDHACDDVPGARKYCHDVFL